MICNDCPRGCNKERNTQDGKGFCNAGTDIAVAKILTHMWEEPCLSGYGTDNYNGTENIFLFGCNLRCVFCQNFKINGSSKEYDKARLSYYDEVKFGKLLLSSANTGANNIGIVSGDHYIRQISDAITPEIKASLRKPLTFNCNGYEKPEMLELLRGKIDIFMPDFKYADDNLAKAYSFAENYADTAKKAISKMFELTGPCEFSENGLLKKGVIIRHLIMPGNINNTLSALDWINETFKPGEIILSLMSQYTPVRCDFSDKKLNRPISQAEKSKCIKYLEACENITLAYIQEDGVVSESFIPDF